MDVCGLIADRKIREAMAEGAFDNLAGAGKPLDLTENPFEDPSDRMANRLLKNNGFSPDWIEEAKEIEAESARLRSDAEISRPELLDRLLVLNRRIAAFNLRAPSGKLHKPPVKPRR